MLRIDTFLKHEDYQPQDISNKHIAIIDVMRCTTSLLTALENGAAAIYNYPTIEASLAAAAEKPGSLLCGERKGIMIDGFDHGNSPREYTPDAIAGRTLVFCSTNGSQCFALAKGAASACTACLRNADAAAEYLAKAADERINIICAGTVGRPSLDDIYTAGALIARIIKHLGYEPAMNDSSRIALITYEYYRDTDPLEVLKTCSTGAKLFRLGYGEDMAFCAQIDVSRAVPLLDNSGCLRLKDTAHE
ncbi:MAG: 2-phosphosulfolactate phosphatase [Firmicutes bacterium]|nr:2-phosphosulfolactate phosphatase [Bacillota bacterium]